MGTDLTTRSNAELTEEARTIDAKDYHDELSLKIREVFAGLSDQEIKNAISSCSAGKCYIIEIPTSDIFEEKYLYYINNTIRMSPLFQTVKRVAFFDKNGEKYIRVWLRGRIRKFLPKGHKHYKSWAVNTPRQNGGVFLLTFLFFYVIIVMF